MKSKAQKRKWGWVALGALVAVLLVVGVIGIVNRREPKAEGVTEFRLSAENYVGFETVEIDATEYQRLVDERQSFLVVAHMTICPAEFPLTDTAKKLAYEKNLRIYFLDEREFEKTGLKQQIKYLPSLAVIREGELVGFLDAEADADVAAYKTAAGLEKWLETKGVKL